MNGSLVPLPTDKRTIYPLNAPGNVVPLIFITVGVFLALKLASLDPVPGDEGIYFYLARRMSEGHVPHRDFFFAHNPFHLLPAAIAFKCLGFSFPVAKAIPVLAAAAALPLAGRAAGHGWKISALVPCLLLILSYDYLRASSHYTGANLAAVFTALGLERSRSGRDASAGLAFAAAGLSALYAAPVGVCSVLVLALYDRKRALRMAAGGLGLFILANLVMIAIAGNPFIEQVYGYHFAKARRENLSMLQGLVAGQPVLICCGAAGFLHMVFDGSSRRSPPDPDRVAHLQAGASLVAGIVFLAVLPRVFSYYGQPFILCGAVASAHFFGWLAAGFTGPTTGRSARGSGKTGVTLAAVLVAAVTAVLVTARPQHPGMPGVLRYLRHENRRFHLEEIVDAIHSTCPPDGRIAGSSGLAPLLALASSRLVALDKADTNVMRFVQSDELVRFIDRLQSAGPGVLVLYDEGGLLGLEPFRKWCETGYVKVSGFRDHGNRPFHLWVPKAVEPDD